MKHAILALTALTFAQCIAASDDTQPTVGEANMKIAQATCGRLLACNPSLYPSEGACVSVTAGDTTDSSPAVCTYAQLNGCVAVIQLSDCTVITQGDPISDCEW